MKDLVKRYLRDNYIADDTDIDSAVESESAGRIIADAEKMGSYPYWVGDQVAALEGWEAIDEPAENAYDGTPGTEFEDGDDDDFD